MLYILLAPLRPLTIEAYNETLDTFVITPLR